MTTLAAAGLASVLGGALLTSISDKWKRYGTDRQYEWSDWLFWGGFALIFLGIVLIIFSPGPYNQP